MQSKDPVLALPASVVVDGPNPRACVAADGAGFNPGYRVAKTLPTLASQMMTAKRFMRWR